MNKRFKSYLLHGYAICSILVIFLVFIGCGSGSDDSTDYSVNGYIQKGPFISGSSITIQELNDNFDPTGQTYQTVTSDDFGSFSLGSNIKSDYVEIIAQGFYFNEIAGSLSSANITLRTISNLSTQENVNANILTTLEKDRIKYLVLNEGKTFIDARNQAEDELLNIFHIPEDNISTFEQMDICKEGESNAILLAISSLLQGDNTEAELSELISKIIIDIKEDGTLDDTSSIDEIKNNSMYIDLDAIRTNLINRYNSLGLTVTLPNFEDYVDSDGDGIINKNDPIPFTWVTQNPMLTARQQLVALTFNDKIYAISGVISGPGTILDVVEEYEPVSNTWATKTSIPNARYRASGAVVNGLIYIIGGSGAPTIVDVYDPSTDKWTTQSTSMPTSRSQLSVSAVNGKIYAFGGQPTLTIDEYDPSTDTWSSKTATSTGRQGFTTSTVNGKIHIIGGWSDSLSSNLTIVEEYDPSNDTIVTKNSMPTARHGHTSSIVNGTIYVIGGSSDGGNTKLGNVERYDPLTDSWITKNPMPTARRYSSSAVINDEIYVIGGESSVDENLSLVDKYYPNNDI